MKNFNALLKKVELFERLATYGDRKAFLQAIAQEIETFPAPSSSGINAPYVPGTEPGTAPASPAPAAPSEDPNAGKLQMPEQKIVGTPPAKNYGNPATVELLQIFLNKALKPQIETGQRGPIAQDSKFGPETLGALKEWANANGVKGSVRELADAALERA